MLRWDFTEKVGEMEIVNPQGQEFKLDLYQGNAYLIMVYNYTEDETDMYQLYTFFADKEHMLNCLGLKKGYSNIFDDNIKSLTLTNKSSYAFEIIKAFSRAYKGKGLKITFES